jgi:hypothetical protein
MATSYSEADDTILQCMTDVMREYHRDLADAGVRVGVLVAANDKEEPAVKHGGYPAIATVKIVSLKDRVLKQRDAEVLLDKYAFDQLSPPQQDALFDHVLSHIQLKSAHREVIEDKFGEPTGETELRWKTDDLDRPKLVAVKGDWSAGAGFELVCRRHREHAIEFYNLRICHARAKRAAEEGVQER